MDTVSRVDAAAADGFGGLDHERRAGGVTDAARDFVPVGNHVERSK
jgi:hypothetical protein